MLAYSYLRFSNPEQLKGDSFRRQTVKSDEYIARNGLTLDTTLKMHDLGLSAYDGSNVTKGALGGFLRAIESGRVVPGSYLIVESLDRLSRANPLDALQQFISIINAGIVIVTLSDKQTYTKAAITDNPMLLLVSILIMVRANEESEEKSKRLSEKWKEKRRLSIETGKVLTRITPLWIRVANNKYELIPERAEVVRRIFEMARQGVGGHTIVNTLNMEKVEGFSKVGLWNLSYVHKILTNIATYGAMEIGETLVENFFPAIINKDEFNYIGDLRTNRKTSKRNGSRKGTGVSNLFSGLLKCGYCGASMQMSGYNDVIGGEYRRIRTISCHGARTGATKCSCIQWAYEDFEATFILRTVAINFEAVLGLEQSSSVVGLENQIAKFQTRVNDWSKKIENLYKAMEEDPIPGLVKRVKALELERDGYVQQLKNAETQVSVERMKKSSGKKRMSMILKLFNKQKIADDIHKRIIREALSEQIRSIIDKIVVYPTGPARDRAEREMRFMNVHFKSGHVVEMGSA